MSIRVSGAALGELQKLFGWGAMGTWTDSQLIDYFLGGAEESEAAFRVLVQRHGPMVLGVCRRVLGNEHAAEDAFQATFLVLVKKAPLLRDRGLLTSWLYGVALRVSNKERVRGKRRQQVERRAAEQIRESSVGAEPGELRSLLDEEIRRLPERYRLPLLLCHVEGLRHDEVARRLGCPVGTVESRLSRARERLRSQLTRRGLAPTGAAIGGLLEPMRAGSVASDLVASTVRRALSGHAARLGAITMAGTMLGRAGRMLAGASAGAGTAAATFVISVGVIAAGMGVLRSAEPVPPTPASAVARIEIPPPPPLRNPRAIARPLSRITIDGKLDDWPAGMPRYPIRNLLTSSATYREKLKGPQDLRAEFMAGYDARAGLIYLAVVVVDDEHAIRQPSSAYENDAVEVYVDGTFSKRKSDEPSTTDWKDLNASEMPALQYVGLDSKAGAYGNRFGANPSLLYGKVREPRTRMATSQKGNATIYEWAVQPYDHFPDVPTRLVPGHRVGLEVAVVDKDGARTRPAFLTWGPAPTVFKGFDAGSLGELYLSEGDSRL